MEHLVYSPSSYLFYRVSLFHSPFMPHPPFCISCKSKRDLKNLLWNEPIPWVLGSGCFSELSYSGAGYWNSLRLSFLNLYNWDTNSACVNLLGWWNEERNKREKRRKKKKNRTTWGWGKRLILPGTWDGAVLHQARFFSVRFLEALRRSDDSFERDMPGPRIHIWNLCVQQPLWFLNSPWEEEGQGLEFLRIT